MQATPRTLALAAGILLLAACSTAPEEEVAAARESLDRARASHAETYAPEQWAAAERADASLLAELAVQEGRARFLRSYNEARRLADETDRAARRATDESEIGYQAARNQVEGIIGEARAKLAEVRTALEQAPSGKGTQVDLASMRSDTGSIETLLGEAESASAAGDLADARTKAQSALEALDKLETEIDAAKAAHPAKRA